MEENNLDNLRHSCAHLLAAAVMDLWPKTLRTIGPSIENGFYYDFDFGDPSTGSGHSVKISEEDFPKIEDKMHEILNSWEDFEGREVSKEEALKEYEGNVYKKELIEEFSNENQKLTFYKSGDYEDLCRGGHIENPKENLKNFKLLSVAGAYWRGSEKNKMLTRIYGTVFPTQEELDAYLKSQEQAKENDHRTLGAKLGIFVNSDLIGKGLPLLTDKGATIKRELERFIIDEELKRGYKHVITPPIAKTQLYKTSGHYPYYKDTMYPVMKVDEEELILRPMTCPHHFMIFKSQLRSYKELPLRIAEIASQFRYEKSGELTGLVRIRTFTLNDAHIVVQPEKAKEEIRGVLELIDYANSKLGLQKGIDYRYRLSLGDRNDTKKYFKDDKSWEFAENVLREVLTEENAPFFEANGEAAFYGPKIDVQIKKVNGKEETAFTVQYDFVMPKRFEMTYIDADGSEKEPVVIHRAAIGCLERTIAFLLEKYAGNLPIWLNPVQVKVLPISEKHLDYANTVKSDLEKQSLRVEVDSRSETLSAKIRDAQIEKVSYMLVVGDKEVENNNVTVRSRASKDQMTQSLDEFLTKIKDEIINKTLS